MSARRIYCPAFCKQRGWFSGEYPVSADVLDTLNSGSRSTEPMTAVIRHFGAMPLPVSSSIAFLFLGRCDSPMPRSTFGALVNWMFS